MMSVYMIRRILFFCLLLVLFSFSCSPKIGTSLNSDWQPLLIDKGLSNFEVLNGTAEYLVEENTIIGISKMGIPNSFLCTKEKYTDFILEFEVWGGSNIKFWGAVQK